MLSFLFATGFIVNAVMLYYSVMRNIQYMEKIDELEESLRTTVQILDEQYEKIEKKTRIEVFSDEPIIRELVRDISVARNAVLTTARLLDDTINVESSSKTEE